MISVIGKPIPLYAGATAKCMLAYQSKEFIEEYFSKTELIKFTQYTVTDIEEIIKELEKIREQGYSISTSEVDLDTYTVTAPIFKKGGSLIASLSLSCPTYRYSLEFESKMKAATIKAANEITKRLGGL